jgi:hypothetical protein
MPIELPRRGKSEPVPILDGRQAKLCAIYAIGHAGKRGPLKIGYSNDPRETLEFLQRATWRPLYIHELAWVRNEKLGARVVSECHRLLASRHISAAWYHLRPEAALVLFQRAAVSAKVEIASHDQYLASCRPRDEVAADRLLGVMSKSS